MNWPKLALHKEIEVSRWENAIYLNDTWIADVLKEGATDRLAYIPALLQEIPMEYNDIHLSDTKLHMLITKSVLFRLSWGTIF
jgi:hypothetical protein